MRPLKVRYLLVGDSRKIFRKFDNNTRFDKHKKIANLSKWYEFEGCCAGQKGYIYECTNLKQFPQYTETINKIVIYVTIAYNNGKDINHLVLGLEKTEICDPEYLSYDSTYLQKWIWGSIVKQYLNHK